MNIRPVRLNHQKLIFVQNFKICKNDYLDSLLSVQGLFDDATLPRADLRTLTCCVEDCGISTIVVANSARVSKPV
jgi:hypothetical protein